MSLSYTIPDMEWPVVAMVDLPKSKDEDEDDYDDYDDDEYTGLLLSEICGSTNGNWFRCYGPVSDRRAATAIHTLLASYKVPVYHITVEEYTDIGHVPGYKGRVPYIDSRTVYIWTFSAPNTPVVHVYRLGGDLCHELTCVYEKTMDAEQHCSHSSKKIIERMKAL